jgi:uncharacterized protein (DUF952 family)
MIYKILRAAEFATFVADGSTEGAPVDRVDGYVHFSTAAQVSETAAKHFAGEPGLWLLGCDEMGFGAALRWEPSRGGQQFPHLYRRLDVGDVVWARPLPLGDGGAHAFPGDLA